MISLLCLLAGLSSAAFAILAARHFAYTAPMLEFWELESKKDFQKLQDLKGKSKRQSDQIEELTSQLAEAESQARQSQNQLINRGNELREVQKQLDKENTERKRLEACLVQWVEKHDEIESKLAEVRRIVACQ